MNLLAAVRERDLWRCTEAEITVADRCRPLHRFMEVGEIREIIDLDAAEAHLIQVSRACSAVKPRHELWQGLHGAASSLQRLLQK